MAKIKLTCGWVAGPIHVEALADFFVENVTPDYISHGEILTGRATDGRTWSPNLREIMIRELSGCVESFRSDGTARAATASEEGELAGLAIVQLVRTGPVRHAWIEDLVISQKTRSHGVGGLFLEWIEKEFRSEQMSWIFLESGIDNLGAHRFFERNGYSTCSQVMQKNL